MHKTKPIWLELLRIILHSRGGIIILYAVLYLAYISFDKLSHATIKIAQRVRKKLSETDKSKLLVLKNQDIGWWGKKKGKCHWFNEHRVPICGTKISEGLLTKCDSNKCKLCERIKVYGPN